MVIRYKHILAALNRAQAMIDKELRMLCNDSLPEYARLKRQFHFIENCDLYIDDDMPELEYGYIMKCLRAVGLTQYEYIVKPAAWCGRGAAAEKPKAEETEPEEDNILYFEDLIPAEAFDDGNFEVEMEEIRRMREEEDDDDE